MYKPEYIELYEVLPKYFYEKYKYLSDKLWLMFDERVLWTADRIRMRYGKIIMNTWIWGGNHQFRGWRPLECEVGALLSQHKFGRGLDLYPVESSAEEIRQDVMADPFCEDFQHITCIEANIIWFHMDTRNRDKEKNGLLIIHP